MYIFIYDSVEKIKGKLFVKLLTKIIDYIVLKKGIEMKNIFIYYLIIINNYWADKFFISIYLLLNK